MAEPAWMSSDRYELLSALADQVAVALERAILKAEADLAAADAALLAHLGEVLERTTGLRDRARALVRALAADRTGVAVVHALDENDAPRVLAYASSEPDAPDVDSAVYARVAAAAVAADGPARERSGAVELFALPLRARNRMLGVLTMGGPPRAAARVTRILAQRVATRAALAFDNALLYEQERTVSHSLQMGLLGEEPAPTPHAAIATAYRPGTVALEVGGDWYDAFTLPDGRLAMLVGDVVGHGLEAAVAMGQLRGAVRALAVMGAPHQVLEGLDLFVEQVPAAAMATLVYAELDPEEGRLAYACAGHPPPLLIPEEGEPRLLWDGRSTPLGSSFATTREQAVERVEPGDTIVLYSDGLVERRTDGISAGLESLLEVGRSGGDVDPAALVERILDTVLEDGEQDDDACILAVRRLPRAAEFAHAFPAAPNEVARMRRALAVWLEEIDLDPDRRRDAVLATAEAAANAAEHAYDFDGEGRIVVDASVRDGRLQVAVRDEGVWRTPSAGDARGRGRIIIETLMEEVTIDHTGGGTIVRMSLPTRTEALV
jgi:serine/threonine-protein kinase RsbW